MKKLTTFVMFVSFGFVLLLILQTEKTKEQPSVYENENPREAWDALSFLNTMRAYPNKDIPADGYVKAWKQHSALMQYARSGNERTTWQNIGPTNVGGRTCGIAIDPTDTSVIWLGSASGGLWKSTTGGIGAGAWEYVPTGFPVLGVSAIAINPDDHNEMFIGTGEAYSYGISTNGLVDRTHRGSFGMGILKSTDGGLSWNLSLDWLYQSQTGVWEILYDPLNTNIIYAATTEGVYKTIDGGTTWNNVLNKLMVMDMVINTDYPDTLYAGVGNEDTPDKGIYKTTDGGLSWMLLTNGLPPNNHDGRITISSWEGNQHVLIAIIGNRFNTVGTYKTTNGGQSWSLLNNTDEIVSYQGWYAKGLLIKPNDQNLVIAGGVDPWRSNNGGGDFNIQQYGVHSDIHDIKVNPLNPNKIYVVTDGGLYRSNNFGQDYYECADGYVTSQHYIGSVSAQNANIALGGLQDNNTIRYDGIPQWTPVIGGDGSWNAIDPTDDYVQFGSYQYLNVLRSYDQGWTFYDQVLSYPGDPNGGNPAAFLAPFVLCPSNVSRLYAGESALIRSDDQGSSWNEVTPNPLDNGNVLLSIGVSYTNDDSVYFATAPTPGNPMHVYISGDGGFSYNDISAGLPDRYPRRISVNPQNSAEVYVVFSGFNGGQGGHIFKSTNAGDTWTDISTSLPDLPFHCLAIDPLAPKHLYAGCDFGIYVSTNGGATWLPFNDGLPQAVMVFDLVISPSDQTVFAFTHGNGVYKNDLLDVNVSVPEVPLPSVSVFPNPATDFLFIEGKEAEYVVATVFDLNGRKILSKHLENDLNHCGINVESLPAGNYLLKLEGNTSSHSLKFMVAK